MEKEKRKRTNPGNTGEVVDTAGGDGKVGRGDLTINQEERRKDGGENVSNHEKG